MTNLDIICNVPDDIVCAILAAAGIDDNITIRTWKDALSFLWVCRPWRIVAEPILFGMLICGNEDYDSSHSNCKLIMQRHCFDKVNKIIVCDSEDNEYYKFEGNDYPNNIDMMMHLGKLFVDEAGKKDMDSLEVVRRGLLFDEECLLCETDCSDDSNGNVLDDQYFYDQYGNRVLCDEDELNEKCRNASAAIVSKLAALCPSVTHILFRFTCSTVTNIVLANTLINNYMKQLVKLKCNVPVANLKLKYGRNIQSIMLGDYNPKSGQSSRLPTNYVQNLSLSFYGEFSWNLFKCGALAPVFYDNLKRLDLSGSDRAINRIADYMNTASQPAEKPPLVVFPRLQTLVLQNICLSYNSLKHFLQFPIKVLCVAGYIHHACQLYGHDLANIDRLILRFNCYYLRNNDNAQPEFIQLSNKLLAKMSNISEVHLELDIRFVAIDWTDISWIYVTHFCIKLGRQADQIFTAISKMLNLVCLDVFIYAFTVDTFDNVIERIANLKRNCTEPLQSKIKIVMITCYCFSLSKELLDALEFLWWYLPELEKLTVVKG